MSKRINKVLTISTIFALIFGIIAGFWFPNLAIFLKKFGDFYIKILKVIIGPMIFCSMSLFVLKKDNKHKFLIGKTVLLFIIMFVTTFLLSSLIVVIFRPGSHFSLDSIKQTKSFADFGFVSILKNLLPKTIDDIVYGKSIFFIIVCSLLFAFLVSLTSAKKFIGDCVSEIKKSVDLLLKIIISFSPIAVFALVSNMIATYDVSTFKMGLTYIVLAYSISVIAIILVMIIPVWLIAKINPFTYIRKVSKVWLMTISTCSSAATLPYTIKVCNEGFGVDERITDVVVPLGCTIHMCGGAVSFSLLSLFVAQLSGTTVTIPMFLLMILSATLINMAAPGIPGGGVVIGITYLSIFNLPLEIFYGMYIGMYKLLDMAYTTLNVTGDVSANILLDYFENKKIKVD